MYYPGVHSFFEKVLLNPFQKNVPEEFAHLCSQVAHLRALEH